MALVTLDAMVWKNIIGAAVDAAMPGGASVAPAAPRRYSLPVTHGTSTLLMLPNDVTVLTDAGSDAAIVDDLQKTLPSGAPAYIDLAIISSPQTADYEGYQYLLAHYGVGAFLYNGRADDVHRTEWTELTNVIIEKHIPLITIGAGDSIHYGDLGAGAAEIDILAPDAAFARSPNASDTAIIQRVIMPRR